MKNSNKIIIIILIALLLTIGALFIEKFYHPSATLNNISLKEFKKKVDNKDSFILLIVKDDCPYCELYEPKFKKIVKDYQIDNAFYINISSFSKEDTTSFNNMISFNGTPTTVFFDKGIEMDLWTRINGNKNTNDVITKLKTLDYIKEE